VLTFGTSVPETARSLTTDLPSTTYEFPGGLIYLQTSGADFTLEEFSVTLKGNIVDPANAIKTFRLFNSQGVQVESEDVPVVNIDSVTVTFYDIGVWMGKGLVYTLKITEDVNQIGTPLFPTGTTGEVVINSANFKSVKVSFVEDESTIEQIQPAGSFDGGINTFNYGVLPAGCLVPEGFSETTGSPCNSTPFNTIFLMAIR